MYAPVFAVVGRPNKGKSSIVATLARDSSVHIDSRSGSTTEARKFPMKVDGETLYELVDTPGMQRAGSVLEWLNEHNNDASRRPATIKAFYDEHKSDPRFRHECEMLGPIIEGAGIIYVVDGSCPFGADYQAEMEILRWTGRPSLAVINPIESNEYVDEWKVGLGQYFSTVRVFDAHRAEPRKQLELLELFGHLDPDWQESLSGAVATLREDRSISHNNAASLIADLIIEALTYQVEQRAPEGAPEDPIKKALLLRYKNHQEKSEKQTRRQIRELYNHDSLDEAIDKIQLEESDLFHVDDWYLWGLKKWQMVSVAASIGVVAGGSSGLTIDAMVGGVSGGATTLISGIGGAATWAGGAWYFADRIAKLKVKGIPSGGRIYTYGPTTNLNFPFVLLGRSIYYHALVSTRAHASQASIEIESPPLDFLTKKERKTLAKLFALVRAGKDLRESRAQLSEMILAWCEGVDS